MIHPGVMMPRIHLTDAWLAVITLRVAVNPFAAVSSCYTLTFHRWAVTLAILIGGVTNAEGTASVVPF